MAIDTITLSIDRVQLTITYADIEARTRDAARAAMDIDYVMAQGLTWYENARAELSALATRLHVSLTTIAAITAVYSSCMPWERNIPAAILTIEAYMSGARGKELPAVTRNYECVRKAERILNGETPTHVIVKRGKRVAGQSYKTLNFFFNLLGASHFVTIDVWMWRAMSGNANSMHRPDGHLYVMCANALRAVAAEVGILPASLQAIIWTALVGKAGA